MWAPGVKPRVHGASPGKPRSRAGSQRTWLSVAAQENIIFDTPPKDRYPAALKLLGIDPIMLTGAAGHA